MINTRLKSEGTEFVKLFKLQAQASKRERAHDSNCPHQANEDTKQEKERERESGGDPNWTTNFLASYCWQVAVASPTVSV